MLRGLTTITYLADDVAAAARWYAELLGTAPYFTRPETGDPAYVEFRIGDYSHELGIMSAAYSAHPHGEPAGATAYGAVDDLDAAVARALALGATAHEPITTRGDGFVTASVVDPFGNILGLMFNQHYLDVLAQRDRTD
ncbi:VOC family protein [Occultella kanbiaonis]|uniref:VOC family protein n=1 Tax=Occultella kanbiaonis TaxID=2675754 RepID=UPI0013D6D5CE|nr:VOC family protein [Occultella kanbiaonis]